MKRAIETASLVFFCVLLGMLIGSWLHTHTHEKNMHSIMYSAETASDLNPILGHEKPAIIVLGADYCPTCVNYKPYIEALHRKAGDEIIIKYIDTVANPIIRNVYNVELIPSTLFFDKSGEPYRPSPDLSVLETDEVVKERRYISDDYKIVPNEQLLLNPHFEYGQDNDGNLAYCKFVGLLNMTELLAVADELTSQN